MKRTATALAIIVALSFSAVAGAVEVLSAIENSWTSKTHAVYRLIEGETA